MNNTLIKVENISQIYGNKEKNFYALKDIYLEIFENEFLCILGPSGCGKSTLLRIITGLQKPSQGRVIYRGKAIDGVNPYSTIVFQTFALFPWLTVQENVEVVLKTRGIPKKIRTSLALDLLDRVGLDGFESAYPRELSGGMRQKVSFARAMAVEPELLCLDEPFSALDVLSAETIRRELLELWIKQAIPTKAILMVSHNIEEAVFMANRIIIMEKNPGRIVAEILINLPYPRDRKSSLFLNYVDKIYEILAGETKVESMELGTIPGTPGVTHWLPDVRIGDLIGFLKYINESPKKSYDIYQLAEELNINFDKMLKIIDALELLGFVRVSKGDISLTSLGETFSEASILGKKEIFGNRIRKIPIFKWVLNMLKSSEDQKLNRNVILMALNLELPYKEANKQINLLIEWGRYGEILAYDDENQIIILEPTGYLEKKSC